MAHHNIVFHLSLGHVEPPGWTRHSKRTMRFLKELPSSFSLHNYLFRVLEGATSAPENSHPNVETLIFSLPPPTPAQRQRNKEMGKGPLSP